MTIRQRVNKAIDRVANNANPVSREQYEDDYDGFTHSTYSGLADQVEEELENEGYDLTKVSDKIIEEFVFELF